MNLRKLLVTFMFVFAWWIAAIQQSDVNPTNFQALIEQDGTVQGPVDLQELNHPTHGPVWLLFDVSLVTYGNHTYKIQWVHKTNEFVRSEWSDPFVLEFGKVAPGSLLLVTGE